MALYRRGAPGKQISMESDAASEHVPLKSWIGLLGAMLGAFMAILDIQITNASLNDITGGIGATLDEGSWISTSYLIAEIITIPLTAWLSRAFSARWYLLVNVALFIFFSMLCGLARSLTEMIIFRAAQGFTGGVMIPMALTLMIQLLPPSKRGIGGALFGMTATLAPAIGPSVGGWLTDNFGWPSNFYVNVLPGAVMLATLWITLPHEKMKLDLLREGDWIGIASMAIGLGSLTAFLEEGQRKDWLGSEFIQRMLFLAVIFLPIFIIVQLVKKKPLVDLRIFLQRNVGFSSLVNFALGLGLYGSIYIIPLYLAEVQGYSPFQIGVTLIWVGIPQLFIFPFVPRLMQRFDLRLIVTFGVVVFAASCFLNIHMSKDYAYDQLVFANIVRAFGQPFTIVPLTTLATGLLAREQAPSGSALFNIARNLGGSVGIAVLSTLLTRREQFHSERIGESVTQFSLATQARIQALSDHFAGLGFDAFTSTNQAYAGIANVVRREANIMAFNDCFLVIGLSLLVGGAMVWFCRTPPRGAQGSAH
jgi:DHA2 family multidrug resistance protein